MILYYGIVYYQIRLSSYWSTDIDVVKSFYFLLWRCWRCFHLWRQHRKETLDHPYSSSCSQTSAYLASPTISCTASAWFSLLSWTGSRSGFMRQSSHKMTAWDGLQTTNCLPVWNFVIISMPLKLKRIALRCWGISCLWCICFTSVTLWVANTTKLRWSADYLPFRILNSHWGEVKSSPASPGLSSLDPVHVTETHREPPSPHGAPLSVTPEPELAAVVRQLYASGLEPAVIKYWLVVWNMFFPYIGKNNPNWLI